MTSSEIREMLLYGSVGGMTLVGALWFAMSPTAGDGGMMDRAAVAVAGNTYYGNVSCGARPKQKPSIVKGFFGMHGGKRVSVRAWSYSDASERLKRAHPGCRTQVLERSRSRRLGFKVSL